MSIVHKTRKGKHPKNQNCIWPKFKATRTHRLHLSFASGCSGLFELAADSSFLSPPGGSEEDAFNSLSPSDISCVEPSEGVEGGGGGGGGNADVFPTGRFKALAT
ncbi:MAG: hypothetical protein CM15mP58_03930 [Burkholderiaceae bacterium]|nr:MAG: hypothetical protein CM15mP58_03930 [Burkholderiaceae bacterium]